MFRHRYFWIPLFVRYWKLWHLHIWQWPKIILLQSKEFSFFFVRTLNIYTVFAHNDEIPSFARVKSDKFCVKQTNWPPYELILQLNFYFLFRFGISIFHLIFCIVGVQFNTFCFLLQIDNFRSLSYRWIVCALVAYQSHVQTWFYSLFRICFISFNESRFSNIISNCRHRWLIHLYIFNRYHYHYSTQRNKLKNREKRKKSLRLL